MERKITPKPNQCWVEKKTGRMVRVVEGNQNGLVRYDTLETVIRNVPKWDGYWAEELNDWHKRFERA